MVIGVGVGRMSKVVTEYVDEGSGVVSVVGELTV